MKRFWILKVVMWNLLLTMLTLSAFAQVDTAWVRRYNGPGNYDDKAFDLAVDGSGNLYVTGSSIGSMTSYDYTTIKYYPNGDTGWVRRYNGLGNHDDQAEAIAVDDLGSVYVTGRTNQVPWPEYNFDYTTIKYYPDGDTAWVRTYNGPANGNDFAHAIAVDDSGNVYVTGESKGSETDNDYATIKYSPSGDTAWLRRYHGPVGSDKAYVIVRDDLGNVYVTGESYGSSLNRDYATVKYHPNGDTAWVRRYNGTGDSLDIPVALTVDHSGNVYVTGYSTGIDAYFDYATIKYFPNGDTAWVRRYDGLGNDWDGATAVIVDGVGNVYVTGGSEGDGSLWDYVTIKYYVNGDTAWLRRYNGPANLKDFAASIAADGSGNIYVTGYSNGNGTSEDYTTIKYDSLGNVLWVERYDGPGNSTDYVAPSIVVDASGNIYVTGMSYGDGTNYDFATIKYEQKEVYVEGKDESSTPLHSFCCRTTLIHLTPRRLSNTPLILLLM